MTVHDFQEIYRQIVENVPDAILFADRDGIVRLWNRGAERVFGFSSAEALGQSLDLIIPEPMRARHWEGYRRVMAGAPSRYGQKLLNVPALHRSGERISCEFSILLLQNDEGAPLGIAAILRDVSARREEVNDLLRRLASCEGRAPSA